MYGYLPKNERKLKFKNNAQRPLQVERIRYFKRAKGNETHFRYSLEV